MEEENENNRIKTDDSIQINQLRMDDKGKIRNGTNEVVMLSESIKIYTILGWVSTSLAAFVSPVLAIAGIIFGVLINKKIKGRGNIIIIASVILGVAKFVLSYIFLTISR